MAKHDCGHACCVECHDPCHDHFLEPGDCPRCKALAAGPPSAPERTVARLCRQNDGETLWNDNAVRSLIGREPVSKVGDWTVGRVRIVDARVEDGWVVVEMESLPTCSTCEDTGVVAQQGIRGAPGSGFPITCPDCGPTPSQAVDADS